MCREDQEAGTSWSAVRACDLLVPGVPPVVQYDRELSLGYTYLSKTGFTFAVGAGVRRTSCSTALVGPLGLGWTWRRDH